MKFFPLISIFFLDYCTAASQSDDMESRKARWSLTEIMPIAQQYEVEELGKKLFFDESLSVDSSTSCASCHQPELGWSDGRPTAVGLEGKVLNRATPSIINSAYIYSFMWDGRAESLEEQALMPFFDPLEMGLDKTTLVEKIEKNPDYSTLFADAFGSSAVTLARVQTSLAVFQRSIVSNNTRFDQWLNGNSNALSPKEQEGFELFTDAKKSGCINCHNPPNFTDNGFHNIGLTDTTNSYSDPGRYSFVPLSIMKGAFKTPGLRGVPLTAPYFHNGSASTLEDVVNYYNAGARYPNHTSPSLKNINLSKNEVSQLVAFLNTLR